MKQIIKAFAYIAVVLFSGCAEEDYFLTHNPKEMDDEIEVKEDDSEKCINHEYVDLGLPSGTLWATCNVGATKPEEKGAYIAWGERMPKNSYYASDCKLYNGSVSDLLSQGAIDYNGNLVTKYDAATARWGDEWRMPTMDEIMELYAGCESVWTTRNGMEGRLYKGKNGKSIFFPENTYRKDGGIDGAGGYYWTSTVDYNERDANYAYQLYFQDGGGAGWMFSKTRNCGLLIRPVRCVKPYEESGTDFEYVENSVDIDGHKYVDLGLPSGTLWAVCNVGANAPEDYGIYIGWGVTSAEDSYRQWYESTYANLKSQNVIDGNGNLTSKYDAATAQWGKKWRMPTFKEIQELMSLPVKCTTYKGVTGRLYKGKNGNTLFLPAAGRGESYFDEIGNEGFYWSSTAFEQVYYERTALAYQLWFTNKVSRWDPAYFLSRMSVRPVFNKDFEGEENDITENDENKDEQDEEGDDNNKEEEKEETFEVNGHEYVNLGLPSGTMWATCNIGATKPEEYGDYYAWSETKTKESYAGNSWWCNLNTTSLLKYGVIDRDGNLTAEYDAATVNWGSEWRMPTEVEFRELINKCRPVWTTENGVYGMKLTSSNGNYVFFPASGYYFGTKLSDGFGYYYTSSTYSTSNQNQWDQKNTWYFSETYTYNNYIMNRPAYYGGSVRPILNKK